MGEPRTWTIWKRPGSVDGMIRGPVADAVEVVERSVLGRVEEERDALREALGGWALPALDEVRDYLKAEGVGSSSWHTELDRAADEARAALSASHAPAVDEGGEDG